MTAPSKPEPPSPEDDKTSSKRREKAKKTTFFDVWELEQRLLGLKERESLLHSEIAVQRSTKATTRNLPDQYQIPDEMKRGLDPFGLKKTMGLALSGGGIRAASFSLGVMQGLNHQPEQKERYRLLDHIDFLSTVSGGGYAGSALTYYKHLSRLSEPERGVKPDPDIDLNAFPKPESEVLNRHESRMLDFTRFRKNHLTPTHALNFNSLLSVALRTIFTAWPIYLSILTVAMLIGYFLAEVIDPSLSNPLFITDLRISLLPGDLTAATSIKLLSPQIALALLLATLSTCFFVVWMLFSLIASMISIWLENYQYGLRRWSQIILGMVIGLFAAAVILAFLPILSDILKNDIEWIVGFVFGSNTIAGISLTALRDGAAERKLLNPKIILLLSSGMILIGSLILAFSLAEFIYEQAPVFHPDAQLNVWWYIATVGCLGFVLASFFARLNYLSFTRMYRDRLMEAFMPNYTAFRDKENSKPAGVADRLAMADCNHRPLHIINTNVVLSTSPISRYRGRSGDNFILAPHVCGSWVTGYKPTQTYSCKSPDDGIGLATAMAISGAAFSPRVGPSGWDTVLRHPLVASVSSFLNLRLGFWLANPKTDKQGKRATFFNSGLRGILNYYFDEERKLIELTDGGHFENTGIFELLRRRVDVIVLADASADKQFNFKDIGIAIERARVDQSIDIRFNTPDFDLTHLMPGSAGKEHYDELYNLAGRGYAIASIKYPAFQYDSKTQDKPVDVPEKYGLLIYLKTVITRKMPLDIYSYKGAEPNFPYQPITDQNFDESQFEAYRELGYQITKTMLSEHKKLILEELSATDEKSRKPGPRPKLDRSSRLSTYRSRLRSARRRHRFE